MVWGTGSLKHRSISSCQVSDGACRCFLPWTTTSVFWVHLRIMFWYDILQTYCCYLHYTSICKRSTKAQCTGTPYSYNVVISCQTCMQPRGSLVHWPQTWPCFSWVKTFFELINTNLGHGTASQYEYERVSYLLVPACIEPNYPTDSLTLESGKLHVFEYSMYHIPPSA